MTSYVNVFGNETIPPSGRTYRLVALAGHSRLNWPFNYEGPDYIADITEVAQTAENWHLALPPANQASKGEDFIIRNVGLYAFQVNNASDVPVATVLPGQTKYFYLTDNSTTPGVWNVFTFGTGTSGADASQLRGNGLTVDGSRLAVAHPVNPKTASITASTVDRATVLAFTGGSNTLTLPPVADLGNNWFCGVRNAGSGSVTIQTTGVDRIDDQSTLTLTPGESLFVFCTGATYYTIGYGRSTQFQFTKLVKDISAGGSFTLTSGEASNKLLQFVGGPVSNVTIIVPAVVAVYYVQNAYTGTATVQVKTAAGAGATLSNNNDKAILFCDGTDIVAATSVSGSGGGGGGGTSTSVDDGAATAPSYTFNLDTDLGFYRIGTDTLGLAAGGSEAARWGTGSSSVVGSFGIGTSTPAGKLDVRGVGVFSGGTTLSGTLPTGTVLHLGAADTQETREMIDAYGSSSGPFLTLRQSRGTASAPTASQSGNNLGQVTFRGRGGTGWSGDRAYIIGRATENWTDTANGSMLLFAVTPNGSTTPEAQLVLDQNGWLTVNSSSAPLAPLDVIGNARILGNIEAGIGSFSKNDIPIVAANTTTSGTIIHAMSKFPAVTVGYWGARDGLPFIVWAKSGTVERFRVDDGTLGAYAYAYNTISDERDKTNWEALPNSFIELLAGVKHGYFDWIDGGGRDGGVSAQSFQAVLPHFVHKDSDGRLSVSYGNAALLGVIQLANRLLALEERVGQH
jgi:hypothetical protein